MLARPDMIEPDFPCSHCGQGKITEELKVDLAWLDRLVGGKLVMISGFRCVEWNRLKGGAPDSRHLFGDAGDVYVEGMSPFDLAAVAKQIPDFDLGGIGVYRDGHIHVDRRHEQARWWK